MGNIKLKDLVEEINKGSLYGYTYELKDIIFSRNLLFEILGESNVPEIPKNIEDIHWQVDNFIKEISKDFTGEEIVNGKYFLYDYCGHSGDGYIIKYNTLAKMEECILCAGGITNMFTTENIVIIDSKCKKYNIYYTIEDKKHLFNKELDNLNLDKATLSIEWLD